MIQIFVLAGDELMLEPARFKASIYLRFRSVTGTRLGKIKLHVVKVNVDFISFIFKTSQSSLKFYTRFKNSLNYNISSKRLLVFRSIINMSNTHSAKNKTR